MTYLVLARKYRPRVFADVVGQEVATGTLRGAIEEKRVGHAYLFCGRAGRARRRRRASSPRP
jgi:DNA polymerase-3 subunit gamma/tau